MGCPCLLRHVVTVAAVLTCWATGAAGAVGAGSLGGGKAAGGGAFPSAPEHTYDRTVSTFSPKGRLYQVDYARAAVGRSLPIVGIRTRQGVLLCARRRCFALQDPAHIQKIHIIDRHIAAAACGLASDAAQLIREARARALEYRLLHQEGMPVEMLVSSIGDIKQVFTQVGGMRPWGASFLIAGADSTFATSTSSDSLQLYTTDPSGTFAAVRAAVVGANATAISSDLAAALRQEDEATAASGDSDASAGDSMTRTLEGAATTAVRLLDAHGGTDADSSYEVATVTIEGGDGGGGGDDSCVLVHVLSREEVEAVVARARRSGSAGE